MSRVLARIARFIRSFGFTVLSVGLHVALVVLCVLFSTPADSMAADREWIEVDMPPALGQPHGKDEGKDLGSHIPKAPKMPEPEPFEAPPPVPPPDPEAIPTTISSAQPAADGGPAAEADAGDAGSFETGAVGEGEGDPTTPVGSENVPPAFGSPDGVPGGQGTGPRKISPQYMAILAAWARARFPTHGHGLGPPPEGTRPCARVSIQIAPDRQVSGSSMTSSGQAVWDDKVRAALPAFSGASVPADPEGGPPPPSIGLNVCWD